MKTKGENMSKGELLKREYIHPSNRSERTLRVFKHCSKEQYIVALYLAAGEDDSPHVERYDTPAKALNVADKLERQTFEQGYVVNGSCKAS
jgi:hypothetical protein